MAKGKVTYNKNNVQQLQVQDSLYGIMQLGLDNSFYDRISKVKYEFKSYQSVGKREKCASKVSGQVNKPLTGYPGYSVHFPAMTEDEELEMCDMMSDASTQESTCGTH